MGKRDDHSTMARWTIACWTAIFAVVLLTGLGCDGTAAESEATGDEGVEVVRSAATNGVTKINAGAGAISPWVADTDSTGGSQTTTNNSITIPSDLVNPAPTAVYKSARITTINTTTPFTYTLPGFAAGSTNTVRLHFAEWTANAQGQRVFNVTINGVAALTNLDLFMAAAGTNRAVIKEYTGPANLSGQYVITFTPVVGRAVVSGVEVVASSLAQPTRIHAGGADFFGFAADVGFSGGSVVTNNHTVITTATHAAPTGLYWTARTSTTNFTYTVPGFVAGSMNNVRLHFAETAKTAAGQRVFNVTINGTQMLSSFDIFAAAGGGNRAIVKEFRLAADANGRYVIRFDKVTGSALVSGIEVVRSVPWFTRTNMSNFDFSNEFNARAAAGYRMTYVSAYRSNGATAFAAVWDLTPGPSYYCLIDMNKATFESQNASMIAGGWTLSMVNGYDVGGTAAYVALWTVRSSPPPMITRVEMDRTTFGNEFNTQAATGYVMTHIGSYALNGQDYYVGTWEQRSSPGWYTYILMDAGTLQSQITSFQNSGFRVVDLTGLNLGGTDYYSAIFEATAGPPTAQYYGADRTLHTRNVDDLHRQGFTPTVVSPFPVSTQVEHYVTLWRNDVYSASDLATIDVLALVLKAANALPSVSLAIAKDGRLVFAKAYGLADGVSPAHVNSRYRIASVSKTITSAGIMRAIDQGRLNLDTKVFGTGALLGTSYGTQPYPAGITALTIRQLLSHTSGFDESVDPFTPGTTPLQFMNKIVNTTPPNPNGSYNYANSDYIILARVLEKVYGGSSWKITDPPSYSSVVIQQVLNNANVQTMNLGYDDLAERETDEVTYSPSGAYNMNIHNMDGSGGWVATPIDLLRVATHVDGLPSVPDVLGPAVEQRMYDWTVTCSTIPANSSCYALGWLINQAGQRWHNGMMTGTWAMLQQMSGLDLAIVTNDTTAGSFPFWNTGDDIAATGINWTGEDFFGSPD